MNIEEWIKGIEEESVYHLASRADCASPDSDDSPGAILLRGTRDAIIEAVRSGEIVAGGSASDQIRKIASGADEEGVITFYTYPLWRTFVDLGAFTQDLQEAGMYETPTHLDHLATAALSIIVERLGHSLIEDLEKWAADQEEDEDGQEEE